MKTIKAFDKNLKCKGFQYEIGKTYEIPKEEVSICERGFHASANFDIGETVNYYPPNENIRYCIIDINVVEKYKDKVVGDKITILKEVKGLENLSKYDRTGRWIYKAGINWKKFDYRKGFEELIKKDKTGMWIYYAGLYWKDFNYEKGTNSLTRADKTGMWIYYAGLYWKKFNYDKGLEALKNIGSKYYDYVRIYWNFKTKKQ